VRGQVVSKADFRGGVNLEAAPYFLSETEARDLRNVVSTSAGAIRKRDGAQTLATVGATLTSLFAALGPTCWSRPAAPCCTRSRRAGRSRRSRRG
jgi:hypothetical protein